MSAGVDTATDGYSQNRQALRAISAETVSRLFLNSVNIVLHGNSFYMVEHLTCHQSESRLFVISLNSFEY
ncbi:unnamed protein product [Trichogramma brassicae]|uniref:Uncharacterized protein n=1 Tax=Trichogramma brassicae TaxID=86971 RepID=A0A6H5IZS6_9HYME|nr:unnamed protein product [Trichogramma brassicae]